MTRYTPLWLQAGSYAASVDRRLLAALYPDARTTGMDVSAAGTGMDLHIAPGSFANGTVNGTGSCLCVSDAVETVTLDPAPPSGTDRMDIVYVWPRGADLDGGANDDFIFAIAKGTDAPSGSAQPPTSLVPGGAGALALVTVPGGAASIVAGDITDWRAKIDQLAVPGPYVPAYPPWPRENYNNGYAASGGGYMAWPVKTMSCRAQVTTDAAGRTNVNVGQACTACGIPVPTVMVAFQAISIGVALQITSDTGYPWPDPKLVPIRCFSVTGVAYANTFNILYTAWFQNGAA